MTVQTKRIIDISDILAIHFACKNEECGAVFSLPLFSSKVRNAPTTCPICKQPWTRMNGSTYELQINELAKAIRTMQEITTGREQSHLGCWVTLEISPEQADRANAER